MGQYSTPSPLFQIHQCTLVNNSRFCVFRLILFSIDCKITAVSKFQVCFASKCSAPCLTRQILKRLPTVYAVIFCILFEIFNRANGLYFRGLCTNKRPLCLIRNESHGHAPAILVTCFGSRCNGVQQGQTCIFNPCRID